MSDSESDIEIKSALPKMEKKKQPRSPSEDIKNKKITTKMMIVDALVVLKTRKGVSLYAIKKYLTEKYEVNTEKVNYLIKKTIKAGVEDGTFIQMKGIGASGSFKLDINKNKPKAKKKPSKPKENTEKNAEKKIAKKTKKKMDTQILKEDKKPKEAKKPKKMEINQQSSDKDKNKQQMSASAKTQKKENKEGKKKTVKSAKSSQTPAKKRAVMMKRYSIGSIIKPPKMKPKKA